MMALDVRSARALPRDTVKVVVNRTKRLRREKIEAVLKLRALGHRPERIAARVGLPAATVDAVIADERRRGDARALTDQQAAAASARAERRAAPRGAPALPPAPQLPPEPEPAPAVAPRPPHPRRYRELRPSTLAAFADVDARAAYVAMLRDRGQAHVPCAEGGVPDVAANAHRGLLHLADLYDHHATFFPTYQVTGGGIATLESTDRMFPRIAGPRAELPSPMSSPAGLCADA